MAAAKAISKKPSYALEYGSTAKTKFKPLYYAAAFCIPALLVFISYVIFGVYPFGDRSVLTLDLNGQYVYYFENIRRSFWEGDGLLYSWSRNLSGGYQGVIGYYLASPFTFIVILMPRKLIIEALMLMQLCKIGACGLTFAVFAQKSKGVKPFTSVIFSTMYALSAFMVIQLIDPMWLDGPIFLPLIILGVEYLVDDGRKLNYIIPTALMFIANFYIGFMVAIFVALYFVYYVFFGTKKKFKDVGDHLKVWGRMILATAVVLMCSYIMIMPVYNALALGKFDFSHPDYSFKTMFNPVELLPTLLPNQYYSVNVDEDTRMYGRPEIYCGVLAFVLAPLFFFNKKISRNRKIGTGLMLFVMFFSMWIKPLNMMWHGGQDPNWLPYRYSFIVSFILVAMAAEVFANLDEYKMSLKIPAAVFAGIALVAFIFKVMMPSFNYNEEKYKYAAISPYSQSVEINGETKNHLFLGTIVFGLILAGLYLYLVYLMSQAKSRKQKNGIAIILAGLVIFETGYNTFDTIFKIDKEVYYSSKASYNEIMSAPDVMKKVEEIDDGFYRSEKTFFRNSNDNQAYDIKGISHSSSVMNARIIRFIETLGYSTKSYETRYDGNTPIADSLLGIKYVLDDPRLTADTNKKLLSPYYQKIASTTYMKEKEERAVDIYENVDALPIGFMADDDILRLSYLGNDNPFNSLNNFLSSMTGNTPSYEGAIQPKEYFYRTASGQYTVHNVGDQYEPSTDPNKMEVILNECYETDYAGQHCYNANPGAADPTVRVHITAQSSDYLYMFLRSDNPKTFNLWVSTEKNAETGEFENFKGYGSYYGGYDYSIVNLGSFEPGTEIEVRMTILQQDKSGANEYIMVKDFQFYHFNYDLFHEDIQKLKESPWKLDMDKTTDSHLVGEVDAKAGQVFYTSIPYEPGWTIKVDGKKVKPAYTDEKPENGGVSIVVNDPQATEGSTVILNAFWGIRLPEGHHTVEMSYSPPGFRAGVVLLILGIGVLVLFYMYDRKNNPVLIGRRKAREARKNGQPAEPLQEKKKVQIIKSKGPVASVELNGSKKKPENDGDDKPAEEAVKQEEKLPEAETPELEKNAESSAEQKKPEMPKPKPPQSKPGNGGGKKNNHKKKKR